MLRRAIAAGLLVAILAGGCGPNDAGAERDHAVDGCLHPEAGPDDGPDPGARTDAGGGPGARTDARSDRVDRGHGDRAGHQFSRGLDRDHGRGDGLRPRRLVEALPGRRGFMDPTGSGAVVMGQVFMASKGILPW